MYYHIIEYTYVGNDGACDDKIEISTFPALKLDGDQDECIKGYCGATGDWLINAHGRFMTLEKAREKVEEIFGDVHMSGNGIDPVVEIYGRGRYAPMDENNTIDWVCECENISDDIKADTTDERIDELIEGYEEVANDNGCTLDIDSLRRFMQDKRQELLDEQNEAA